MTAGVTAGGTAGEVAGALLVRCAACGATVDAADRWPARCPRATAADRHHVLLRTRAPSPAAVIDDPAPLVRYGPRTMWWAFARRHGWSDADCVALARDLDARVAAVDGHGFSVTPLARAGALSDELGFAAGGGVWVKDETGNVSGSHKARHLAVIMLVLLAAERLAGAGSTGRARLAIASCGNAALAAATIARAADWPLDVFVPPWADPWVLERLSGLGAEVVLCPRRAADPPGDPCVLRFREAVEAGAVPFGVQGTENAVGLDGGRMLGWELAEALAAPAGGGVDRCFVQVGGGALAAGVASGLADAGMHPRLHAVQAEGCAPLARAWAEAQRRGVAPHDVGRHWDELMWPWEQEPRSLASGILDDETYDWIPIVGAMASSGGRPVVAPEARIVEAHDLGRRATGIDVCPTGTAGLAGLLTIRHELADDERVLLLFTGHRRG